MGARSETTFPVIAEEVAVGRRTVPRERVHIRRRVATEQQLVELPLRREHVDVERVPVDQIYDEVPGPRHAGGTLIIPVVEEELVVVRRYRVREELHVHMSAVIENHQERVSLRRHEVDIEREAQPEDTKEHDMGKTVIAVYGDPRLADDAVRDLAAHGIRPEAIEVEDAMRRNPDTVISDLERRNVPHDRAEMYAEAVRRGASVVVADTADDNAQEAATILEGHGAIDIERSAERWRSAGWDGYEAGRPAEQETFDVIEEDVRIGKREVDQGVRVRTFVTERPVSKSVELRDEHIEVSREAADGTLSPGDAERAFAEDEHVITATKEEAVVEKQARVVEQVRVAKETGTRTEHIEETERRRDVEVEVAPETKKR